MRISKKELQKKISHIEKKVEEIREPKGEIAFLMSRLRKQELQIALQGKVITALTEYLGVKIEDVPNHKKAVKIESDE